MIRNDNNPFEDPPHAATENEVKTNIQEEIEKLSEESIFEGQVAVENITQNEKIDEKSIPNNLQHKIIYNSAIEGEDSQQKYQNSLILLKNDTQTLFNEQNKDDLILSAKIKSERSFLNELNKKGESIKKSNNSNHNIKNNNQQTNIQKILVRTIKYVKRGDKIVKQIESIKSLNMILIYGKCSKLWTSQSKQEEELVEHSEEFNRMAETLGAKNNPDLNTVMVEDTLIELNMNHL